MAQLWHIPSCFASASNPLLFGVRISIWSTPKGAEPPSILATYWPPTGHLLATYWPPTGHLKPAVAAPLTWHPRSRWPAGCWCNSRRWSQPQGPDEPWVSDINRYIRKMSEKTEMVNCFRKDIYIYIYTHIATYVYIYIYVYIDIYMCIFVYIYIYTIIPQGNQAKFHPSSAICIQGPRAKPASGMKE